MSISLRLSSGGGGRGSKANAASFGTNVDETNTLRARDPVSRFTSSTIGFLELPVSFANLRRNVTTGLEVNSLPRADGAVKIAQAFGIERRHCAACTSSTRQVSTIDATKTNSTRSIRAT